MNFKKALLYSVGAYLIPFSIVSVSSIVFGGNFVNPPHIASLLGVVSTMLILVLISLQYFKSVKPSISEGLLLGILVAVAGIVIDTLITITIDPSKPSGNLTNPMFWIAPGVITLIPAIIGLVKKR